MVNFFLFQAAIMMKMMTNPNQSSNWEMKSQSSEHNFSEAITSQIKVYRCAWFIWKVRGKQKDFDDLLDSEACH